ncbi:DUF2637 domain-containing protein [Rhodococcus sp. SGAir0479]|uniref:DUF2637 domain-containing protein n=1 Tax=Rhodococcus sp. SGAir0479 TaxID=2567884 RepID=UPI0010CCD2F2|nr:DUF2637 domain-containing protein [Rhodococcus sp. SGAir0479]QCQ91715.1 DUF2637 domain-containing protein [Rhodococcus sp. SGAir0479]
MTRFRFDAVATYVIAILAFALSYANLADLAARAGYGTVMAHAWPLVVDGLAVVATSAVMRLRGGRAYAWILLGASTIVSVVAGGAAHLLPAGPLPGWAGAAVAVIPPLCLLVAPHLAVQLHRDAVAATDADALDAATRDANATDAPGAPDDEPTREPEPDTDAPVVTLVAVPDPAPVSDAPTDQERRTTAQADALRTATASDADAPATTGDAARESNDTKWPRAVHLLVTRPDMSQRAVAADVGMSDAALRRRIGPGGRDALVAAHRGAADALAG